MKKANNKIVLLDFCETIVDFQSFNPFIYYVLSKEKPFKYKLLSNIYIKFIYKIIEKICYLLKINNSLLKKRLVKETKGISFNNMAIYAKEYYERVVSKHLISEVIKLIPLWKSAGYRVILVSAACDLYLEVFAKNYNIDDIVSTSIFFKNGKSSGRLRGKDVIGKDKVNVLKEYLRNEIQDIEFLIGVTDSITDLPMLNLCSNKIVVSHEKHQKWAKKMEEIIWK